jgi:hypothetical protein
MEGHPLRVFLGVGCLEKNPDSLVGIWIDPHQAVVACTVLEVGPHANCGFGPTCGFSWLLLQRGQYEARPCLLDYTKFWVRLYLRSGMQLLLLWLTLHANNPPATVLRWDTKQRSRFLVSLFAARRTRDPHGHGNTDVIIIDSHFCLQRNATGDFASKHSTSNIRATECYDENFSPWHSWVLFYTHSTHADDCFVIFGSKNMS